MLQVFDEGHLTDSQGHNVDFRNTVIIMTSNLGAQDVAISLVCCFVVVVVVLFTFKTSLRYDASFYI